MMRDILEERSRVEDAIERGQPLGPFANVFQGGRTRGLLQSGKAIEPIPFGDVEQGIQGLALLVAQGPGDALIKGFVNFLAEGADQTIEGAESRQLDIRFD